MDNAISKEYEKRVVFFIDILAFKKMIKEKTLDNIYQMLDKVSQHSNDLKKILRNDTDFGLKVVNFSDSLIFSFNAKYKNSLWGSIFCLLRLQYDLVKEYGVLLRGACVIDKLFHDENKVFGLALVKAVELEKNCSIYPRIIISNEIIKDCLEGSKPNEANYHLKDIITQDNDGYYYLDYIDVKHLLDIENQKFYKDYKLRLDELIENGLKESDLSVKQKYSWLKDKHDKANEKYNKKPKKG